MSSAHHCSARLLPGLFLMFLLLFPQPSVGQAGILDSLFTFRSGEVKTGNALDIISRKTGCFFTYDSRLIDPEKKVRLDFTKTALNFILDNILQNDSLSYSQINRYIIIYKAASPARGNAAIPDWVVKTITGTITDFESGEPLPFATIGIMRSGKGTVTNSNGEFGLRITRDFINDSLSISYLGYYNRRIPVRQAIDNNLNIKMMREYIPIQEVIIKTRAPQEILRKAYNSIDRNYGTTPANMTAFYREAVMRKSDLQIYTEAVIDLFKSSYSGSLLSDQMKILKSRKIENLGLRDTLTIRLKAGLNSTLLLDGAKNTFDFLLPENYSQYDYRMTDIVTIDDESAFVIEFSQKPAVDIPLFRGSIYINTENYAIIQAEFELTPEHIQKARQDFINNPVRGYSTWPVSVKYYVKYRMIGGRYFLSHSRGDLVFTARQKKRLFSTSFSVFFELAVTDIRLDNVTRFDRDEIAPLYSVFSRTITTYDHEFWGEQDFLKPEDNLLQALKNMKVRLQEFSK